MSGTVTSWATLIHLSEHGRRLPAYLGLGVDCLFDWFVQLSSSLPRCSIWDEVGLFWSSVSIKLNKDGLEVFKVRGLVLDFFNLVLRISF